MDYNLINIITYPITHQIFNQRVIQIFSEKGVIKIYPEIINYITIKIIDNLKNLKENFPINY
jgi:hypothetical protein